MKKVIAICGKSGSGKDSILKGVLNKKPEVFAPIVSYTTRPKREGEIEGVDYYFITSEQMASKIMNGEMLEATSFNGWVYGTSIDSLKDDKVNIGVYNLEGLEYLIENKNEIDSLIFYIDASNKIRLLRSLNREENPDIDEIIRRYGTDKIDFLDFVPSEIDAMTLHNESEKDLSFCIENVISLTKGHFNIDIL